jgi:RecA-family ATPase
MATVGTGQCANSRSCQICFISHEPEGNGHGRCSIDWSSGSTKQFIHSGPSIMAKNGLRIVGLAD